MVVYTHRIKYKSYNDIIKIKPLFDLHCGSKHCDVRAIREYLKDSDDHTYFIGGGDMTDSIVMKDPRYRKTCDATETNAIVDEQVDMLEDLLSPYKHRIIGLGDGNHEKQVELRCGTNIVKRLCKRLDCKHLGFSWLLRLILSTGNQGGRTVVIRGHHGWGGGSRTQGADLTKFSKDMQHFDADVFMYGHVHRLQSDRVPRLGLVGETLISKPKVICICGTFLKTYSKGADSSYSEEKGYPPVEVGGLCVNIKPKRRWVEIKVDS